MAAAIADNGFADRAARRHQTLAIPVKQSQKIASGMRAILSETSREVSFEFRSVPLSDHRSFIRNP
jgi:hypothetical protein